MNAAGGSPFASLHAWIVQNGGGFFRNIIRSPGLTCSVCCTSSLAVGGRCSPCQGHFHSAGAALADRVGFMTYAIAQRQSGWVMHGYKRQPTPDPDHNTLVMVLTLMNVAAHRDCAARLAGNLPVTHWAAVPSLPAKPRVHPLHAIVSQQKHLPELPLVAATQCSNPRSLSANHFSVPVAVPCHAHVLLLEDTWVGGGHPQSAALALRRAGVEQISTLVVARWLDPNWGMTGQFIGTHLTQYYDASRCPWTSGQCP